MAKVDPFVIKWPEKWVNDAEIRPVIQYLNRFLHDMWRRTGGGDDTIGDTIISTDSDDNLGLTQYVLSNTVTEQEFQVSADYTVTGKFDREIVICANTSPITITMPLNPKDGDRVIIKRSDDRVTLSGNGNTIDGFSSVILSNQYDAPQIIYTDIGWSFI